MFDIDLDHLDLTKPYKVLTNRLRAVDIQRPLTDEQLLVIGTTLDSIIAGTKIPIRVCGKWRHHYVDLSETKRKRQPPPTYVSDAPDYQSTKSVRAKRQRKKAQVQDSLATAEPKGFMLNTLIHVQ